MIKKILKLLKKLWVIFLVVLCLSRLATCFLSCRRSESGIKTANSKIFYASADEVATVAAEPDLTNVNTGWNAAAYPTANLIPYPYSFETRIIQGLTYTVQSDGSIRVKGTSTGYSSITLSSKNVFENGKNYCIGGYVDGKITALLQVRYTVNNADRFYAYYGNPLLWEENFVFQTFFLVGATEAGKEVDITIYPMLNAGETAYPYQPPFDLIWKDGYKVGYDNGYNVGRTDGYDTGYGYGKEDGYKEGYGDGLEFAEYGIFQGATVNGNLLEAYTSAAETATTTKAYGPYNDLTYISGGVNFQGLTKKLETLAPYGWNQTEIYVNLKNPVPILDIKLIGYGNSTSFFATVTFIDTNGKRYAANWTRQDGGEYTLAYSEPITTNVNVSKIYTKWGGGVDGLQVSILQAATGYDAGYDKGYNEGLTLGTDQGYDTGYEKGEEIGYQSGYNNGRQSAIEEGIDGLGIFYGVVTIMRVMFQEVTKLLSAPIVGDLTIGLFVVGIPMTFVIIDLVIGLIRKFTGRSGND